MGLAKTAASGMLLIAARGQKPLVLIGTAILAAVEVPTLIKAFSDARQVFGLPTSDPKQLVEVCPADDALAKALHFEQLSIVAPPGVGNRIGLPSARPPTFQPLFPGSSLKQLMKEIDGLKEAPKTIDSFPQRSPAPTPSLLQPPPAPRAIEPRAPNRQAAVLTGAVFDARSKRPVGSATVQVTVLTGPAEGHWWKSSTSGDGTFDLRVPGEDYKLWVKVPGYDPYSSTDLTSRWLASELTSAPDSPYALSVRLHSVQQDRVGDYALLRRRRSPKVCAPVVEPQFHAQGARRDLSGGGILQSSANAMGRCRGPVRRRRLRQSAAVT